MFHYIEVVKFFSDHKTPGVIAGVYLLISSHSSATFESVRKTLKITNKSLEKILTDLESLNLFYKEDEFLRVNDIVFEEKSDLPILEAPKQLPVSFEVEKIVHHLNEITGRNFQVTSNNNKDVVKLLALGYSVESFLLVNQYYSIHWNTPKMVSNINPGTLYNKKFPERLQIAENYFGIVSQNRSKIYDFISFFTDLHKKYVDSSGGYKFSGEDVQALLFWLNSGYELDIIKKVVSYIVQEWSNDIKFKQYLVPSTIFSDKWPSRVANYNTYSSSAKLPICKNNALEQIIRSLKISPDEGSIESYNSFFLRSDVELVSIVISKLSLLDAQYSYRLTPLLKFVDFYRDECSVVLNKFVDELENSGSRKSENESSVTDAFVEWFGGWDRIQKTDPYLWKSSIVGYLKKIT